MIPTLPQAFRKRKRGMATNYTPGRRGTMVKTGRILTTALAVWSCGMAATCQAQTHGAGEVVTLPSSASGHSYATSAFGDVGPGQAPEAYCPPPGEAYCPPPGMEHKKRWWERQPLWISPGFLKPPRGATVQLEYLHWSVQDPGSGLLGAEPPLGLNTNPDGDFDRGYYSDALFDNNFDPSDGYVTSRIVQNPIPGLPGTEVLGFNYVPRMDELSLNDNNGMRLTFEIPTYDHGTIELSGWLLGQASDEHHFGPKKFVPADAFEIIDPGGFPFPIFINGEDFYPTTTVNIDTGADFVSIPYDTLDVAYRSDLFGADFRYVVDALAPQGEGLKLRPTIGFKYVSVQESMYQHGEFQPQFGPLHVSNLNTDTTNNFLGPTLGLRAELEHRWFTVGVQPEVAFTGNIAEATATSNRFVHPDSPKRTNSSDYFDFAPILDIKTYARIKLSDHCRFTVGYDAMWLSRVFRASEVMDYRITEDENSNINTKNATDHVTVDGLSLGLEFMF